MMATDNRLRVQYFLKSYPEVWAAVKSRVYRTRNKDEGSELCMAIFKESGLTHTDFGTKISKTSIRFAMQEIN